MKKSFKDKNNKSYGEKSFGEKKPFRDKEFGEKKSFGNKSYGEKSFGEKKPFRDKEFGEKKSFGNKSYGEKSFGEKKPFRDKEFGEKKTKESNDFFTLDTFDSSSLVLNSQTHEPVKRKRKRIDDERSYQKPYNSERRVKEGEEEPKRFFGQFFKKKIAPHMEQWDDKRVERELKRQQKKLEEKHGIAPKTLHGEVRLNRYISSSGVCSRREADEKILAGMVKVNGETINSLGTKVKIGVDTVYVGSKLIKPQTFIYILMNKPKNHITTAHDPEGRPTVMDLLKNDVEERVYPVGRLDRNTTGLLLLTNDGDLAKIMSHPSHTVKKLYYARLDKPISDEDVEKLVAGFELEDGFIQADKVGRVEGSTDEIGIEIHSGRNRVVRRMFEHLGYQVTALDRVMYSFLSKKGLKRGFWRFLTAKEVNFLKMNHTDKSTKK